jgi:hypothetical protein
VERCKGPQLSARIQIHYLKGVANRGYRGRIVAGDTGRQSSAQPVDCGERKFTIFSSYLGGLGVRSRRGTCFNRLCQ